MSDAPVPKLIMPFDTERTVSISPHRAGQAGTLIIIEDEHIRVDLHLSDAQMRALHKSLSRDITVRGQPA